jgi:prepilin-type N-terminal cleavage/methylation domain-containing protein
MRAQAKPRQTRRSGGFSLVELLIVVAIIGILISIAVPSLRAATRKGHRAAVLSDAKELHAAMARYYTDKGGFPDAGSFDVATLEPLVSEGYLDTAPAIVAKLWQGELVAYVPTSSGGATNDKYWMLMRAAREEYSWFLVASSDDMPGWAPGWYDGAYVYDYPSNLFVKPQDAAVVWW